jgi:hypothetical protein
MQVLRKDGVIEVMVMWLASSRFLNDITSEDSIELERKEGRGGNPFRVLVRFLEIFSRFDWSKWSVSVTGLVPVSMSDVAPEVETKIVEDYVVECDPKLATIVNKYRDRLISDFHRRLQEQIELEKSSMPASVPDRDQFYCDVADQERDLEYIDQFSGGLDQESPKGNSESKQESNGRRAANVRKTGSVFDLLPVDYVRGEMCVLDPTRPQTNLCMLSKTSAKRTSESNWRGSKYPHCPHPSEGSLPAQQEVLTNMFKIGLQVLKESIEVAMSRPPQQDTPDGPVGLSPSIELLGAAFPILTQSTAFHQTILSVNHKEIGTDADVSHIAGMLRTDTFVLESCLAQAESILCPAVSHCKVSSSNDLKFSSFSNLFLYPL